MSSSRESRRASPRKPSLVIVFCRSRSGLKRNRICDFRCVCLCASVYLEPAKLRTSHNGEHGSHYSATVGKSASYTNWPDDRSVFFCWSAGLAARTVTRTVRWFSRKFEIKLLTLKSFSNAITEQATYPAQASEDWNLNMLICDMINDTDEG